jgi:hypothetical protein
MGNKYLEKYLDIKFISCRFAELLQSEHYEQTGFLHSFNDTASRQRISRKVSSHYLRDFSFVFVVKLLYFIDMTHSVLLEAFPDWKTPNTYDIDFKPPSNQSGVYIITESIFGKHTLLHNILYIGSAKNLKIRYEKHEVLRMLKRTYEYVQFYFKEEIEYKKVEKQLIKKYQPKYNTQWR